MALAIEWYLDQLEASEQVDDCVDTNVRVRIKCYIDWSMAQEGPSHVTREVKRQILEAYLYSREGREKFAGSMVKPVQVRYQYYREILDTRSQPFDWTWAGVLDGLRGSVIEYENFLSMFPDSERFIPSICEVRKGLVSILTMYDEALLACAGLDLSAIVLGTGVTG